MRLTNAFGDLLTNPAQLSRAERIDALRRVAGRLLAEDNREVRWLGECLGAWLQNGGELDAVIGVRPERGSRATAQAKVRQEEVDGLLLQLAVLAGTDRRALQIMRDELPCPTSMGDIVSRLKRLKAPTSDDAVTRARRRSAAHSR
ncbi:MAG TPA: hypothetical protein VN156_04345 [Pseudomonas sp.]|nr:hypothetical protein [Pseudomonas sp.]